MYGGGFATVPAYLADMFGTQYVGAIHGRLLTAWSTAGIVGPFVIGYIRDAQIAAGVERAHVYDRTLYILSGFLVLGLICNALVRPVAPNGCRSDHAGARRGGRAAAEGQSFGIAGRRAASALGLALAWLAVGLPIAWGAWQTLQSAVQDFPVGAKLARAGGRV